jgi:hypothetical protein
MGSVRVAYRPTGSVTIYETGQFPHPLAGTLSFQVPQRTINCVSRRTWRQHFLQHFAVQVSSFLNRFNLCQNRRRGLIITFDWNAFAASAVLPVAYSHDNNPRFRSAPARNAERFSQRPDFFLGVDGKAHGGASAELGRTQRSSHKEERLPLPAQELNIADRPRKASASFDCVCFRKP